MSDDILNENLDDEEPIEEGDVVIDDSIVVEGDSRYLPEDGSGGGDLSNVYQTTDSESTDIADDDYIPFYDTSTSTKKKSLWSNLVNKLKSIFYPPIADIVNVYGAKNLIPLSVETQTINGVTITVQDDGSIILNGTATANIFLGLTKNGIPLESGKCILSGVSGGSLSTYMLFTALSGGATLYQEIDGQRTAIRSVNGDSAIFDINKMNTTAGSSYVDPSEVNIRLLIANGYTCDNILIKPMVRLASIEDNTYAPYAKTNQQLTEDTLVAYKTADSASTTINDTDYIPISESNGTTRKKALWTTIIAKIKSSLATVAASGSYNDLSDKPTIPSVVNNLTSDSTTDALSAAQGKALANGSARDSTKLPLAGGTLTGHLYVTKASEEAIIGAGNSSNNGKVWLYNSGYHHGLVPTTLTAHRTATLPNSSGTVAYVENTVPKSGGAFTGKVTSNSNIETSESLLAGDTLQAANAIYAGAINASIAGTTYTNQAGTIRVCDDSGHCVSIVAPTISSNRTMTLPTSSGTLATVEGTVPKSGGTFTGRVDIDRGNDNLDLVIGSANSSGSFAMFGANNYGTFKESAVTLTGNRTYSIPNSTGTIQISSSSSRRVKKNIRNMTEDEAKKLLDVNIVKFDYRDEWCGGEKNQSGVIAEDTIDIMPEVVHVPKSYDPNAPVDEEYNLPPDVDYRKFIPYLIKMVQVQEQRINELESMIKS